MSDELKKAYEDTEFLKRDELRPIRLQLELLKPELVMQDEHIRSTIVLFGSARTPSPEDAEPALAAARQAAEENPDSDSRRQDLAAAQIAADMSRYYQLARDFAHLVSCDCQQGEDGCEYVIVTGGGGGIMEAGNRGAADAGAKTVGLNISLPFEQDPNPYISPELLFHFHYFSIRKMHFLMRAKALCAFPGGYGTLDEIFETLALIQTRKITRIPVLLFGREFWEKLINWQQLIDHQLICPEDIEIFQYCETPQEAWDLIRDFWRSPTETLRPAHRAE
ncbi:MAG: LOG family protein [Verrucomicrobiota bacterium]